MIAQLRTKDEAGNYTVDVTARAKLTDGMPRLPASGYGRRIPTRAMLYFKGRWRRVYVCQISNAGTGYIGKPGAWEAIVDYIETEG